MDTEKIIKTHLEPIKVKKLVLREYVEVLKKLQVIPQKLGQLTRDGQTVSNDELLGLLPAMIADALPEFCDILSVVTDKKAEVFQELTLEEVSEVVVAAFEINDFSKVIGNVKKLTARKVEK